MLCPSLTLSLPLVYMMYGMCSQISTYVLMLCSNKVLETFKVHSVSAPTVQIVAAAAVEVTGATSAEGVLDLTSTPRSSASSPSTMKVNRKQILYSSFRILLLLSICAVVVFDLLAEQV